LGIQKEQRLYKNIKITLNWLIGPALFGWLTWALWQKLSAIPDLPRHMRALHSVFDGEGMEQFAAIGLLTFFNWSAESWKWQWALQHLCRLPFVQAVRSVLAGVALSVVTPNRIGEYGGRILFLPEGSRLQAVPLSMLGGLVQLLVTLLAGVLACLQPGPALINTLSKVGLNEGILPLIQILTMIFIVICLLLMAQMKALLLILCRWPLTARAASYFPALSEISARQWGALISLSMARYLIFIVQYVLMLQVMGVEIGWAAGCRAVAVFFFLMTVVPSIAILELGMRWQLSILVFGAFSPDILAICAASTGIWLINLALPALTGTCLMLGWRIRLQRHEDRRE